MDLPSWVPVACGVLGGSALTFVICASLAQLDARVREDAARQRTEEIMHLIRDRERLLKARVRARELKLRIRIAREFAQQAKPADLLLAEVMHALVDADDSELREWRRERDRRAEAPADGQEVADA